MACPPNEECIRLAQEPTITITTTFIPSATLSSNSLLSRTSTTAVTSESKSTSNAVTAQSSTHSTHLSSTLPTETFIILSTTLTTSDSPSTSPPLSTPPPFLSTRPISSSTLSSGFIFKTFTSTFLSDVNGTPTTIVTPFVTALRSSTLTHSSSHTPIIAVSAIAGIAFLILALATLFCLGNRRRRRKRYWDISRPKRQSRSSFLAGEGIDLPTRSPPSPPMNIPNPFSTYRSFQSGSAAGSVDSDGGPFYPRHSLSRSQSPSSHTRINAYNISASLPPRSTSPTPAHLLRPRASESGSIFQESVWPPPSAASQLMDPLTYPSQSIDLTRAVMNVMSPPESSPMLLLQPNPSSQELGQGQGEEQGQGAYGESEREDEQREFQSSPSPSPPPIPPRSLLRPRPGSESGSEPESPLRPPSTPWLSRPLNPSPRGSPLQRMLPL